MLPSTYFTPITLESEISFTIINPEGDELYLYGKNENEEEFKYSLLLENNIIRLEEDDNPFIEDELLVSEKLTSLYAEFIESNSTGYQSSEIQENVSDKPGYGPDQIFVENKPFSLRHIIDLIDNDDIELAPDFQRNFIWDKTRQSRLIESILLGLPLPSIYLSQYDNGLLTVVDGLQRLNTIYNFYKNRLKLTNLEYLTECNGLTFSQLEGALTPLRIRKFAQTQLMCFVIDYRSPSKLKFDLFRRLNTGGKPLNNPEIRNCLSIASVQNTVKSMIDLESFKLATDGSIKDKRMDGRDAALRFICFYDLFGKSKSQNKPFKNYYNGDMEGTLDDYVDILNRKNREELSRYIDLYDISMKVAHSLFDRYAFRKMTLDHVDEQRRPPINKLLMLSLSVLLAHHDFEATTFLTNDLIELIESDEDLMYCLSWGTNGKFNVEYAFEVLEAFLIEKLA